MLLKRGDYVKVNADRSYFLRASYNVYEAEIKSWLMIVKVYDNDVFILEGLPGNWTKSFITDYIPKEKAQALKVLFK